MVLRSAFAPDHRDVTAAATAGTSSSSKALRKLPVPPPLATLPAPPARTSQPGPEPQRSSRCFCPMGDPFDVMDAYPVACVLVQASIDSPKPSFIRCGASRRLSKRSSAMPEMPWSARTSRTSTIKKRSAWAKSSRVASRTVTRLSSAFFMGLLASSEDENNRLVVSTACFNLAVLVSATDTRTAGSGLPVGSALISFKTLYDA
mmetsp:Transcript_31854/g.105618  ORF Transcript_31854/g.105618 Transcript_31854/m.105618 type:complete len:204 (+) Transcript_31854:1671-2282(+)